MGRMDQFLIWTFKQKKKKKRFYWGCKLSKKNLFLHILLITWVLHLCANHIQSLIILCSLLLWLAWEKKVATLCCEGIQELCNLAQRHFTPKGEMTQGRKKITEAIKVVQFDNAEMKFCLVTSQGAKETEDHSRPFLPQVPQPWHLMTSELMKATAGWR